MPCITLLCFTPILLFLYSLSTVTNTPLYYSHLQHCIPLSIWTPPNSNVNHPCSFKAASGVIVLQTINLWVIYLSIYWIWGLWIGWDVSVWRLPTHLSHRQWQRVHCQDCSWDAEVHWSLHQISNRVTQETKHPRICWECQQTDPENPGQVGKSGQAGWHTVQSVMQLGQSCCCYEFYEAEV